MNIHVETYTASLNKKYEELCGDRVKIVRNADSCILVLADGLGSGVKANILAPLTSEILSTMVAEGTTIEEAIQTITATLPVCRERGVAYSTFIIVQIFYDGRVYLAEYDSPDVIFLQGSRAGTFEREIHVHSEKKVREAHFMVEPGDRLILFSDGIVHAGVGSILNFGWDKKEITQHLLTMQHYNDNARTTTWNLLHAVNDLYQGLPGDDSTVAVAHILEPKETMMMVGPPVNKEDDEVVARKLMSATGKKIVCGGTTSQIISRYLHEEIKMDDLLSFTGDVPPIARIKGIDLVTEGALTIGKALQYLEECAKSRDYYEQFIEADRNDGAFLLAHTLLCDCTAVHFLLGTADNIAHASINYSPISLSQKIKVIEKMGEELKKLGKIVTIEKF